VCKGTGQKRLVGVITGRGDERDEVIRRLINQEGISESNEYSVMYREGKFGWIMSRAKVVTNGVAVGGNVNIIIAGKSWMKIPDNKWTQEAVIQRVQKEKEITILGVDGNDTSEQEEFEVKRFLDDLSW